MRVINNFLQVLCQDKGSWARTAIYRTPHGEIETPAFVAVATQAVVKTLSSEELKEIGAQLFMVNAYHLHLRPGEDLIRRMGGLHRYMNWDRPLMTDSGGFQVFSLGAGREQGVGKIASVFPEEAASHPRSTSLPTLVKVDEDGVEFRSYLDGSRHRLTPEKAMEMQRQLGADIMLVLDECTSPLHDYDYTRKAMERTHRWAVRAREEYEKNRGKQALFGIVQGGAYQDLREESARFISSLEFDGIAIGGSLGKSKREMRQVLEWTAPLLPQDKPRHLLGIGEIEDIFEMVERGIDLFDCVAPTRLGRNGTVFIRKGERFRLNLRSALCRDDSGAIEEGCECFTCHNYSRAYLWHLFKAGESLASRLATLHNLYFVERLLEKLRRAIKEGRFPEMKREWLCR